MERRQFRKKADGRDALGTPKGAEGFMVRQERRQARAMTLARDVRQQVAPTRQQQSAASSKQQAVGSKQLAVNSKQ